MRLDDSLLSFTLPFDCLQCTDLVCTNNEHVESVQILHDNIISAMIDTSVNIPSTKQNKKQKNSWMKRKCSTFEGDCSLLEKYLIK